MKFIFHAYGFFTSSACIFHECYLVDNKSLAKSASQGRFEEALLYFFQQKISPIYRPGLFSERRRRVYRLLFSDSFLGLFNQFLCKYSLQPGKLIRRIG